MLATMKSHFAAALYLLLFGFGTLMGMLLLSAIMEFALIHMARHWISVERMLVIGTGLLSIGWGLYTVYHIGWIDGLFLSHAQWIPR